MDIALLSKMVSELILDHEEVGLPGLGAFMAEVVPASFSDRGYTINPPYKRVTFLPSRSDDDSLVLLYSESNGVDYDQAKAILQHFLEDIKRRLIEEKTVVFPGLGRLRSTRQNNFFFICDEDLDIFPDGFGLAPVSLKNHEASAQEVREAVTGLASIIESSPSPEKETDEKETDEIESAGEGRLEVEGPEMIEEAEIIEFADEPEPAVPAALAEPAVSETTLNPAAPAATAPRKRSRGWKIFKALLITLLILIVLAAIALATFLILVQVAPDFIDSLLYTEEELQIINY